MNSPRSSAPPHNRSRRWESNGARARPQGNQSAQRNYEKYIALAEAQGSDRVAAENYYQYAEHYFRSMSEAPESK